MASHKQWSMCIIGLAVLLYIASLTQIAFYVSKPGQPDDWLGGPIILVLGWAANGNGTLAWCANPLLFGSWVMMLIPAARRPAVAVAGTALALGLGFLVVRHLVTDASGTRSTVTGYGPGFYLWIAGLAINLVGCVIGAYGERTRPN